VVLLVAVQFDIISNMKSISVSVHEDDYEVFRAHAKREGRSIAELVREAMRQYRQKLGSINRLEHVTVLDGPTPKGPLSDKSAIYDEMVGRHL
jgi:Ribbon-helix-helix protein, copG family